LGLEWVNSSYIPCSLLTEKGDIVTATALGTPSVVNIGLNGQYLRACSTCPSGLTWGNVLTLQDTPVGLISWFAATTAPLGWLVADGRAISRATYSSLFAVIGTTYGAGDGSTTFNIPDLRGMFARGWDAAGGIARNCDAGRAFGSTQGGMVGPHNHELRVNTFDYSTGFSTGRAVLGLACCQMTTAGKPNYTPYCSVCDPANPTQSAVLANTGTETRPMNVAMLPCIKYEETLAPVNPASGIPCSCITGKGVILTGSAANSPTALPGGTDGQILVACSSCAQGLAWCNTAVTALNAAVSFDVTSGCAANSNHPPQPVTPGVRGVAINVTNNSCGWLNPATGRFTPTVAGYYQANAAVSVQSSGWQVFGGILKNGTAIASSTQAILTGNGNWNTASVSSSVYMNGSTDYLELGASVNGSAQPFACSSNLTTFSAALMGAVTTLPATYNISQYPGWTSAGTVQSVGVSAILSTGLPGTAPTFNPTTINEVRYRQIGPKEWEVQTALFWTNGTRGQGWYVFTLPAGLQFDLSSAFQRPYTGGPSDAQSWLFYGLPNSYARFSQSGASSYQQSTVIPYDATRYRMMVVGPDTNFWNDAYYSADGNYNHSAKWSFTFTTP
jgi:microcystin-dependent protein